MLGTAITCIKKYFYSNICLSYKTNIWNQTLPIWLTHSSNAVCWTRSLYSVIDFKQLAYCAFSLLYHWPSGDFTQTLWNGSHKSVFFSLSLPARSSVTTALKRAWNWRLSTHCHLRTFTWRQLPGSKGNTFGWAWKVRWDTERICWF